MTEEKRHHHTNPKYYLKAFTIPGEPAFTWEYHRGTPYNTGPPGRDRNPIKRAIKRASVRIDYYGAYEDHLAQLEEQAKPVIDKLRTTTTTNGALITTAEKATLTDYLGLFMKRTPAREARLPEIWKTVKPQQVITLEREITNLMNAGEFTKARALRDELRTYDQGIPDVIRQRSTIEPYELVRNRVNQLPWTFITADNPALITSDNPVRYPEHEGLGHKLAFLTFPISTTLLLLACTTTFAEYFPLPTSTIDCGTALACGEHIAIINHLTITGAHHYLYSHDASEEITRNFG